MLMVFIGGFVIITSLPQLYLCYVRGSQWNGTCAYLDTDELAYAAYVNALIDGRPRRNDPYTAKDDSRFETLFSIQFMPAYVVALPSRVFRLSAATSFIVLQMIATLAASLSVTLILFELTHDLKFASLAGVGVLCLGGIIALNPIQILSGVQVGYDFLPFLRRYVPAVPFPVLILLYLFVWRALTRNAAWAYLAGVAFVFLVYSYFFLWTAAAAWIFTVITLWFVARPEDRWRTFTVALRLVAIGASGSLAYFWLLMRRAPTLEQAQLLQLTHAPDLLRAPEVYGIIALGFLLSYARNRGNWREPKVLLTVSLLFVPFLIFNQQVVTGRSLQSFHYEEFVTNYGVALAVFIALSLKWPDLSKRIQIYLALGIVLIAIVTGVRAARATIDLNVGIDKGRAVALKLREHDQHATVFASDILLTHSIPGTTANPVLWARHLYTFSNVSLAEQKRRFYQYLYYSGVDVKRFAAMLRTDFTARWEVFGAERANPVLARGPTEISESEIENAVREYDAFTKSFDLQLAENPVLSYAAVLPSDDLSNLDRWYERMDPEVVGEFVLYRLTLRQKN
jgi:hypothetical protein